MQRRSGQTKNPQVIALAESDEALAGRALDDPDALTTLYLRYVDMVLGFFRLRTGDLQLSEDLTSQVFTQMLEALPRFRAERFRGWLFVIAHNVLIDSYRRSRSAVRIEDAREVGVTTVDPEATALHTLAGEQLRHALEQLTADQRTVVELRLAGLTGDEIATALGRRLPWVYTTQHRALQRLRALLMDEFAGGIF